MTKWSLLCLAH